MKLDRTWLRSLALGAAGGLCIAIGGSPHEVTGLAFVGPGLLLLALEGANRELASPRNAAWIGVACGVAANTLTTAWIVELLEVFGRFPTIAALPVGALMWFGQALPWIVATWMARALAAQGVRGWIALPVTITIAGSLCPMLFPWRLGISQMPAIYYPQLAELSGMALVDLCLALASCGLMEALRRRDRMAGVIGALALVLPHAYGMMRVEQVRAERAAATQLLVGVLQPNLGIFEKHDPSLREEHVELHRRMTRELEAQGAELVIWPESSYPYWIDRRATQDTTNERRRVLGHGVRGPILFGALTRGADGMFNSAIGLGSDGAFTGRYDKVNLLAFGEYVPFWDLLVPLQQYVPRGFSAGPGAGSVTIAGDAVGVLNCYEDLLDYHARDTAALDPGFLANVTNDAWFGDTAAPHLHHMLARGRSIETRRDMIRAVNTGISALVTATGEDAVRTRPFVRDSFVVPVALLHGATPWVRFGDWVTPALLAFYALVAVSRRWRRRRVDGE